MTILHKSSLRSHRWILTIIAVTIVSAAACGANETILRSGKETPPPVNAVPSVTTLEKDIADMRTADFSIILVLRRRDRAVMDADDRSLIRQQTDQANRRVSSDGGKAVVVGSNFPILVEKYEALRDRFDIENFSKPDAVITAEPIK
jgi:hypothetical protein